MKARRKHEPTQSKNPHRLTIKQHVHSAAAIRRFADDRGNVAVLRRDRDEPIYVRPENDIFCAKRVWNQQLEDFFARIEGKFQAECQSILRTRTVRNHQAVTAYLSVWQVRSWLIDNPPADVEATSIVELAQTLTKDDEELLEANHMAFFRGGGTHLRPHLPGRFIAHGMGMRAHDLNMQRMREFHWGVLSTVGTLGVLCPDRPAERFVPINGSTVLVADWHGQDADDLSAAILNYLVLGHAQEFIFGHPKDLAVLSSSLKAAKAANTVHGRT